MAELLLELLSEEIPAGLQEEAAYSLQNYITQALEDESIAYHRAQAYWTPRRLTILVEGVSLSSKDQIEKRKGPSTQAPPGAIDGFLRSVGFDNIEQAVIEHLPKKGDFYFAEIVKKGQPTQKILAQILPKIIQKFSWSKSMRWGTQELRWIRPLRNILCLFIEENKGKKKASIVDFSIGELHTTNKTRGHRFMAKSAEFCVDSFEDYKEKLYKNGVILDAKERSTIILEAMEHLAEKHGLCLIEDNKLLKEVANLVEWPVILLGHFDEKFLHMAPEIIQLTIRLNQKCFVTRLKGESQGLSNRFLIVANLAASDGGAEIIAGNNKVVTARLEDALYFWKRDQEILPDLESFLPAVENFALDLQKPLDQRMARLIGLQVIFHAKLGTQADRVQRIINLSAFLARLFGAQEALARRAALLAKADLQTEMVAEFPELQGFMGGQYAALQKEESEVICAIAEHYKPQGPTDKLPSEKIGAIVALADKLDILTGFWLIGEKPTGSKDPYALRRSALGVLRLILAQGEDISLLDILQESAKNFPISLKEQLGANADEEVAKILEDLLAFFKERFKVYLREQGYRFDFIDAVLCSEKDSFLVMFRKIEALQRFSETEKWKNFMQAVKRIYNILETEDTIEKQDGLEVKEEFFQAYEEENLWSTAKNIVEKKDCSSSNLAFSEMLESFAQLQEPIDKFFENLFINDDNVTIKKNRYSLLFYVKNLLERFADLSKISLESS